MKNINFKNSFYVFYTNYVIGIYSDLDKALECIGNREYTIQHFQDYYSAMRYLRISLCQEDQLAFGIAKKNMAFDKPYFRQRKRESFSKATLSDSAAEFHAGKSTNQTIS